ncbi:MAG: amino acid adenylation domain-containing protein, partial [Microcoleus sp. SIO2G3]|nr:amino acid adenylation domain-containing protein [Microcoleus sp. SIO2G3]
DRHPRQTLKAAVEQIVDRHEILRTTYQCLPGMTIPLQAIADNDMAWNLSAELSSGTTQSDSLETLLHELAQQPFDLVQGPLLQLSLVKRSPSEFILLLSLPALSADMAALRNLVCEISRAYAGETLNGEFLHYADLAAWQNELLEGADTEAGRSYWRKQNVSALVSLQLPFENQTARACFQTSPLNSDPPQPPLKKGENSVKVPLFKGDLGGSPGLKTRPNPLEFQPHAYTCTISADLVARIEAKAQQYNVSVSEFFLVCWQVLIGRLTGKRDIVLGINFNGRKYPELETALGLLAKFLPLYSHLEPDCKFSDRLQQVNESLRELSKWQEYFSWEQLAELPENYSRFFPICFEFEEQPTPYFAADLSFSMIRQYACIDRFKVKLSCLRRNDTLSLTVYYDPDVILATDIQRLAEQFQTVLASATEHPDAAISQLDILPASEKQQLLVEFNNTLRDYPTHECIHQRFEEQAQKTPNSIAVVFEDQQLTYAELNARANQLAQYLQQLGVKPETLVGLYVDRSLEMMVGLLGILKAGGAYLPLDPALPKEALAFRLQDAQAPILLTQQRLVETLPAQTAQVVCLDTHWDVIARHSEANPKSDVTSENLVYVIYTSGSTGRPKGVAIEHQQLLNYVNAITDRLNLPTGAHFATVSTLAADLGNTTIFSSLCTGGCLHVISAERATDPAALAEYCGKYPIDCLKIVPSHLAALLASSFSQSILPRKRLILGGETASWELIERVRQLAPECQIFNHYGPTETTIGVLTYPVTSLQGKTVPLGRPIANTQVYVLDEQLQPVPIGVSGELYIGGAGLARRGYLNQPELTAERFIPNPFNNSKNPKSDPPLPPLKKGGIQNPKSERLYKTGDKVRYLPDGNIEFLGRIDRQVKIRGFRIELGEIESVLSQHPSVREVVVSARDDESGQRYLVAYVVPSQDSACAVDELRCTLREKLPDYMVPSTFVKLKALPLTPNGKVDHQALPAPDRIECDRVDPLVTPRTLVEEILAQIWAESLGIEQVGIHDNFFDLGGHSLLATQVVSQVRETFQVELRLRRLFETPTVAGLAEHIETAIGTGQKLEISPIDRVSRDAVLPLSFAQQRLWFLDQLEPGNPFYNISRVIHLNGSLNVAALEQSFNEIGRRHEALRTSFALIDGQAVQVVAPALNLTLPIVDLSELPDTERDAKVQQLARLEAQASFDLTHCPLLRVTLLRLREEEHMLLFTIHHIISDGWSAGVLIREVATLYESFCTEKPSPLPELPIQYADFAVWQRQWLQGEVLESQMTYWKQQLGGSLPVLELPTDRPRSAVRTFKGRTQSWQFSQELTQELKALSRRESVTLFVTLLAAFKTLLYRYTGQEDVLVGSPIANRTRRELEGLIGSFVNTLVLRTDLSGNPSFQELLSRLREVALSAYTHQDLPFERLVEALHPTRNLSHTPLFQVMFVLQNAPIEALELPGLSLDMLEVDSETARFDLTLTLTETEQGLNGALEYNTDLFDAATIARMLGHFETLLAGIVAHPEQHLSELPILTERERQQLLVHGHDTQADYPKDQCIHQLFEAQVERTPEAIAVVFEDQQLTYRELNAKANRLAHQLQAIGVGPEVLVGLCVERSLEMAIAILGILKAGGAYVPLDPTYPQQRLAFMLEDARIPVLLTQQHWVETLPPHQAQVICLDADWQASTEHDQDNPVSGVKPENLAYIIYTSGSTGQPKGVLIGHANVVRLLEATQSWYRFNEQDVWTLFHSYAFDFSVWELWGALLYGGRLVVVPYWLSRSPEDFYNLLCEQQVTVLNQTPSAFRQLIRVEEASAAVKNLALRLVIFGGEALELQSLRPWFDRHSDRSPQLVNMYGITETTVHVTYRPLTVADLDAASGSVIGRPIPDLQVYLLDRYGQPVPIGVQGEIYVGGAGLARGYLNRPELTAEKFVPHPDKPDARLYRTGDLGRYLPNGDLEYLGRIDHQVKIRGFRIELGEIENVLAKHPAVQEAVVLDSEDVQGNKRLVAYVVARQSNDLRIRPPSPLILGGTGFTPPKVGGLGGQNDAVCVSSVNPKSRALLKLGGNLPAPRPKIQNLKSEDLRSFLKQQLPDYMVPSAFVLLDALPLTANGKVDRRQLPTPDIAQRELNEAFVAPRTFEEKVLAEIWAEVLGVEQVGIHDNFFALGGDSIRSIQVRSRSQERGLNFSLQQLFHYQTISELAQNLTTLEADTERIEPVSPLSLISEADRLKLPDDVEDAYALSALQIGMLFHSERSRENAIYHDIFSYHLRTPLNPELLQAAVQELVACHPVLRTSFDLTHFSEPLQLVHRVVDVPLPVEDVQHLCAIKQDKAVADWMESEKQRPFDWTRAPLLRVQIHRRTEATFQFTLSFHHAILDGWSVASLVAELFERYFFLLGKDVPPIQPPPASTFRDFVALQKKSLRSHQCQQYWRQKLSDSQMTTLPRWPMSQPSAATSEVSQLEVSISSEVYQGLKKLVESAGVPLRTVLLAAHLRVLSLLCERADVLTGLSSNGRPETTDGARCLGLFLNTLPFRLTLQSGTWIDLVQQTFDAERELLPFRRYPMAQIQQDLARQRLFETSFNFTHFHAYERLRELGEFDVLDWRSFAITDLVLLANFRLNVLSGQLQLILGWNTAELGQEQVQEIGTYYSRILESIANNPHECHERLANEIKKEILELRERKAKEFKETRHQKLKNLRRNTNPARKK